MCGRYRRTTAQEELARRYRIPIPPQRDLPISWNIAPTQDVFAIRLHPETRQRTLDTLRLDERTGEQANKQNSGAEVSTSRTSDTFWILFLRRRRLLHPSRQGPVRCATPRYPARSHPSIGRTWFRDALYRSARAVVKACHGHAPYERERDCVPLTATPF
jgi:SOS response associated peptidase (SRAP)